MSPEEAPEEARARLRAQNPSHRRYTPKRAWAPLDDAGWAEILPHLEVVVTGGGAALAGCPAADRRHRPHRRLRPLFFEQVRTSMVRLMQEYRACPLRLPVAELRDWLRLQRHVAGKPWPRRRAPP